MSAPQPARGMYTPERRRPRHNKKAFTAAEMQVEVASSTKGVAKPA